MHISNLIVIYYIFVERMKYAFNILLLLCIKSYLSWNNRALLQMAVREACTVWMDFWPVSNASSQANSLLILELLHLTVKWNTMYLSTMPSFKLFKF